MPVVHPLILAICAGCAAPGLMSSQSLGHDFAPLTVQFYRGDDQPPPGRFRPDDDDRRYDDRDRERRYDDRYPRDDRGRDDRRREEERGGRASQQLLARQIQDAQTRHNQGVVALQQQFNQRQISRPQLDMGIRQLEVQMNAEIARAQEAQRR